METILKIICSVMLLSDGSQNISHYKLSYQQGYFCFDEITKEQAIYFNNTELVPIDTQYVKTKYVKL